MTYTALPASLFKTTYPLAIRLWHWLAALTFAASLITVLFGSTIFKTRSNIAMVQEQVAQKGGAVSPDQARAVAHEYSDKFWMLHTYIGYGLCLLLLMRMIVEAVYPRGQRLGTKIKNALRLQGGNAYQRNDQRHYIWVKYGYVAFYAMFLVMALTGLGLAYEDVPFLKNIHRPITQVHGFTQYLIYFYIVVHLVGVIRADLGANRGIVSDMINGGQE